MRLWFWVLLSAAAAYAIKLSGYLLPRKLLDPQDGATRAHDAPSS